MKIGKRRVNLDLEKIQRYKIRDTRYAKNLEVTAVSLSCILYLRILYLPDKLQFEKEYRHHSDTLCSHTSPFKVSKSTSAKIRCSSLDG